MTAAMLLAPRSALLTAIARVHSAHETNGLLEGRVAPILRLLLGCMEDTDGDETLEALEAIFEEHDDATPPSVAEAFAELTNLAHILGEAAQRSR